MADGQVITGFSFPFVAKYSNTGNTVTYSNGMSLARGVDVDVSAETTGDNNFYANNVLAESAGTRFSSGTASITVDGLKEDARKLVFGLPTPSTVSVTLPGGSSATQVDVYDFDDQQEVPYLGFAFVMRTMEDGETYYTPVVLPKIQLTDETIAAATQEEEIDWQTTPLEANIFRDDTEHHRWKRLGARQETEAAAVAVYKAILGVE